MKALLKISIIPLLSILSFLFGLFNPEVVYASSTKTEKPVKIAAFNRIVVSGNVEVLLIPSSRIGIAYEDSSEGKVKVTQQGNKLQLVGINNLKARIVIYTNDIYRIEAWQNAVVRNEGVINTKYLQIIVRDNAQANLNVVTEGLYTVISDHSILRLEGIANSHSLLASEASRFIAKNFNCQKINS